jgi:cyanuric acid amidohydrolase
MAANINVLTMAAPDDVSALETLLRSDTAKANEIIAVIGKTEGNGGANDFTRALATRAVAGVLATATSRTSAQIIDDVPLIWSGGCEGVLSPHMTVISRDTSAGNTEKRLVVGVARTRPILPEEIGRPTQALLVADAVVEAMRDARISDPTDVHYVQVKGPLLTPARIADADARHAKVFSRDPNGSKPIGRGILALGVAAGLGEIDRSAITEEAVCCDYSLFSSVASTSVGGEVQACEIVLMGNRAGAGGSLAIGHGVLNHVCDIAGLHSTVAAAGAGDVVAIFAKAEPTAQIFDHRTTQLSDADIHAERHARAALSGMIGAATGRTAVFISGGTEHQCPLGKAPIAVIVSVGEQQ